MNLTNSCERILVYNYFSVSFGKKYQSSVKVFAVNFKYFKIVVIIKYFHKK